jgi:uncharacterized surface protein with fasciclin (FAS1) repeats
VTRALLVLAAAFALALPAGATARPSASDTGTIVETAQAAGSFKTLLALATQAGLADDLASPGQLTVFAPTDAAFRKVPAATLRKLKANPALLKRVLLYHVVRGKVTAAKVVRLRSAKTLAGPAVRIRVTGKTVRINNAAKVTTADMTASNGVIHVIDRVLIPPA